MKQSQNLRLPIKEVFYVVFTFSEEETLVQEDYCEEIFPTSGAAEEYAAQVVEEDGIPRVVIRCEAVASVTVPRPVVQVKPFERNKK